MDASARYMKRSRFVQLSPPTSVLLKELPLACLTGFLSPLKTTFVQSLEAPLPGECVKIEMFAHFLIRFMLPYCSSPILSNFKPCFNATVVQRLIDSGAVPIGKTVMDEFGMGSFTLNRRGVPSNRARLISSIV
jgi:hypothetical protein